MCSDSSSNVRGFLCVCCLTDVLYFQYEEKVDWMSSIIRTVSSVVVQSLGTKPPTNTCFFALGASWYGSSCRSSPEFPELLGGSIYSADQPCSRYVNTIYWS